MKQTCKERAIALLNDTAAGPHSFQSAVTIVYEWLRSEDVPPFVVYQLARSLSAGSEGDATRFLKRVERMRFERRFEKPLDLSGFY